MTALSLSDLRVFTSSEPRIHDLRLAAVLGMANPYKIRELIVSNNEELSEHGEVSPRRGETSSLGGRPGTEYWLNEPQALLICMFSRTPKAAAVRKALIDLFLAWRRGETPPSPAQGQQDPAWHYATVRQHKRRVAPMLPPFSNLCEMEDGRAVDMRVTHINPGDTICVFHSGYGVREERAKKAEVVSGRIVLGVIRPAIA